MQRVGDLECLDALLYAGGEEGGPPNLHRGLFDLVPIVYKFPQEI